MVSNNWKKVEYKVERMLGGKRVPVSGRARGFKGDVEHPVYFIEVKTGKQIPKTVLKWHQRLLFAEKLLKGNFYGFIIVGCEIPKKIREWYEKTVRDCPEGKIPILIMKPRYCREEFVLWEVSGDLLFTTLKIFAEKAKDNDEYFREAKEKYRSAVNNIKLSRR